MASTSNWENQEVWWVWEAWLARLCKEDDCIVWRAQGWMGWALEKQLDMKDDANVHASTTASWPIVAYIWPRFPFEMAGMPQISLLILLFGWTVVGFSPVCHYDTHMWYSRHSSPTSAPTDTVPATPILFTYKIPMCLPVIQVLRVPKPPSASLPLATHLVTPLIEWAQPLWCDIQPHAHTNILWAALLTKTHILLVSDATIWQELNRVGNTNNKSSLTKQFKTNKGVGLQ